MELNDMIIKELTPTHLSRKKDGACVYEKKKSPKYYWKGGSKLSYEEHRFIRRTLMCKIKGVQELSWWFGMTEKEILNYKKRGIITPIVASKETELDDLYWFSPTASAIERDRMKGNEVL